MTTIDGLLAVADAFASAADIKPSVVSWRVFGDSKKLDAIRAGADIQVGRYERALQWLSDNWPAAADWPSEVSRPARSAEAAA